MSARQRKARLSVRETAAFAMFGALMYASKEIMAVLPNIHLLGMFTPISTLLWGVTMLLPRDMPPRAAMIVYPAVCALHGLAYGALYAPWQALAFGLGWEGTIAWIIAGLPFDAVHAAGNLAAGLMILPLSRLLARLNARLAK